MLHRVTVSYRMAAQSHSLVGTTKARVSRTACQMNQKTPGHIDGISALEVP